MRGVLVLGAAALALAASSLEAEARFRLRLGGGSSYTAYTSRPAVARTGLVVGPTVGFGLESGRARAQDEAAGAPIPQTRSVLSAEALSRSADEPALASETRAAPAAKPVTVAAPWCRSGRLAGSGSGFCLIN